MRLAILSDIHGNLEALRRVLRHVDRQSVDAVVNLGDCVSAPLWPQETFDALQEINAETVRGNHDRWLVDAQRIATSPTVAFTIERLSSEARDTLIALPANRLLFGEVFAMHGTPQSDTDYLLEDDVAGRLCLATSATLGQRLAETGGSLVLCGHSHQQNTAWAPSRRLVINPGSVGCPRYAGNADPVLNEAGSPHARYAIATRRNGVWSAELFVLDYDWDSVVDRAVAMGRTDWATAFMKGS